MVLVVLTIPGPPQRIHILRRSKHGAEAKNIIPYCTTLYDMFLYCIMSIILYFHNAEVYGQAEARQPGSPMLFSPSLRGAAAGLSGLAPDVSLQETKSLLYSMTSYADQETIAKKTGHVHGVCRVLHFRVRVTVGIDSHGRIPVKAPTCKRGHPAGDFSPTSQRNAMELPDDLDLGYSPALMAATDFIKDPAAVLLHLAALLDR